MLDVPSIAGLGWGPRATARPGDSTPDTETGLSAREPRLFFASDNRFKAVAGRPLKKVAQEAR